MGSSLRIHKLRRKLGLGCFHGLSPRELHESTGE